MTSSAMKVLTTSCKQDSDIENARLRPDAPEAQLYNLASDLSQKQNVIRQYPEKAIELSTGLSKIRSGHRTRP